jgi:hypothetical protein
MSTDLFRTSLGSLAAGAVLRPLTYELAFVAPIAIAVPLHTYNLTVIGDYHDLLHSLALSLPIVIYGKNSKSS